MTDTNGTVKSAPAYLHKLVKRANDGTFEPVGAATATKSDIKQIGYYSRENKGL
jgi:hypothetical protein